MYMLQVYLQMSMQKGKNYGSKQMCSVCEGVIKFVNINNYKV